jgi:ADP-ribose pyrophosphatase YjhB (NUDIX family)
MNFCSSCGAQVTLLIPEGDNRFRFVCVDCGTVHYQNPNIVTGCIPEWDDRILLCKRAIEPRYGTWTLPAGFLENGESSMFGAAREAKEEANAEMRDMKLFSIFSIPHINQMYTFFRGTLRNGIASPGEESLEVKLVSEDQVPWGELSFPVVMETLKLYFQDRKAGHYDTHYGEIIREDPKTIRIEHY